MRIRIDRELIITKFVLTLLWISFMDKKLIIAIDGYSSCGKSTFAKSIAKELKYIYIDSGAMYRTVTLFCMRNRLVGEYFIHKPSIVKRLSEIDINLKYNPAIVEYETFLNSENVENKIRSLEVSKYVSAVSQIGEVRERLVQIQRKMGDLKGIVMDGRDIGTVVFPNADIKIFMTASIEIRAKRRYNELSEKGIEISFDEIKNNLNARDIADENRDISPLRRANDAIILDNSKMTVIEQMDWVKEIIVKKQNES
jgi:CMP/dCMP kinase